MIKVERKDIPDENKTDLRDCNVDILLQGTTWDLILEYTFLTKKLEEAMDDLFWEGVTKLLNVRNKGEINLSEVSIDLTTLLYSNDGLDENNITDLENIDDDVSGDE